MRTPRFWQSRTVTARLLWPLSQLYRLGYALDAARATPQRAPLPVVAIGNATAGGAGKTPTTLAFAQLLQAMGEAPHIISRGYGGSLRATTRVDPARHQAREVGDEPLLLARQAPTWIGADRLASAHAAHAAGATVILADDAMQHHRLRKDVIFMVVDRAYGVGNGYLLPAGPLRMTMRQACAQASAFVLIGDCSHAALEISLPPEKPCFTAALMPAIAPSSLAGRRFLAFAGIAHPQKFYATLRQCGGVIGQQRDFPDHHPYREAELAALEAEATGAGLQLITTEKDAVRLPPAWRARIATLPVALHWREQENLQAYIAQRLDFYRRQPTI